MTFSRLRIAVGFIALLLLTSGIASASEPCPDTRLNKEWSPACFKTNASQRQVKKAYLRRLHFDRHGFVTIRIREPLELVAVDRQGRVAVPGIYFWGDFDHPNPSGGISRFGTGDQGTSGKCGYFVDSTFAVVVPALYDNCSTFQDGEATACNGCTRYCTDQDCHDSRLVGGDSSMTFDAKGKLLRKEKAIAVGDLCTTGLPRTWSEGGRWYLECPSSPAAPFGN